MNELQKGDLIIFLFSKDSPCKNCNGRISIVTEVNGVTFGFKWITRNNKQNCIRGRKEDCDISFYSDRCLIIKKRR